MRTQPKKLNIFDRVIGKVQRTLRQYCFVKFDKQVGYYYYNLYGVRLFVKYRSDLIERWEHLWKCNELYFKDYTPNEGDVIVDFGAGYGEEAVYLASRCKDITYLGFEILPSVYECLSNTLAGLKEKGNYKASSFSVSDTPSHYLSSEYKYSSVTNTNAQGAVEVFSKTWGEIKEYYKFDQIDLIKMNIEGAEVDVLNAIDDFSNIKRFAIECHDFRANKGDGEHFRTKNKVIKKLEENGYHVTKTNFGIAGYEWADDWVHAVRVD